MVIKKEANKESEEIKEGEIELINYIDEQYSDGQEEKQEEKEESPFKKTLKKIYLFSLAFFIIFLLVSNSLIGTYVFDTLAGKIVSTTMEPNYTLNLNNRARIFFGKENYDALLAYYKANQKTEIKVCLRGEKQENEYILKGIYLPKTYQKNVYSVTASICDNNTIISLHTHPYLRCIFSNQDIESFNKYRDLNSDMIMALMCDEKRFSFYGY